MEESVIKILRDYAAELPVPENYKYLATRCGEYCDAYFADMDLAFDKGFKIGVKLGIELFEK